jgi:hypothetical protein
MGSDFSIMVFLPTDPLYSAKLRIGRADELLDQLVIDIDRFFSENPIESAAEPDPNGTHIVHKLKVRERFQIHWRILATEIIEHLRAALDHATFATFFLTTGKMDSNYAAFPFGKTAADLDNSVRGRSKDLRPEIQTLLRSFNAYKGGNNLLYTLNDLANDCKHGLVTFIGGAVASGEIKGTGWTGGVEFAEPLIWDGEKNEIAYARVRIGTDFQHQGKLRVYVAIPDTEHLPGVGATGVLDKIGTEVARVIGDIESKCRDLGILK